MSVINSKRVLVLLTICLLVVATVYVVAAKENGSGAAEDGAAATTNEEAAADTEEEAENTTAEETTQVNEAHAMLTFDPSDERKLMGESTDVFFGRIIEQVGSEGAQTSAPGFEKPQTQFAVEVGETIKGDATGTVTVNQAAGYEDDGHADHKHLTLVEGDELLEPGQEYLLYTIYSEREGWYNLTVPAAPTHVPINSQEERAKEEKEAREAKQNQVNVDPKGPPPPADPGPGRPCPPDGRKPPPGLPPCDPSAPLPPEAPPGPPKHQTR